MKVMRLLLVFLLLGGIAFADTVDIPELGKLGITTSNNKITVDIPLVGTFAASGYYKSPNSFDLKVKVPAGATTGKLGDLVGTLLDITGMDKVTLRLQPKKLGCILDFERGGLAYIVDEFKKQGINGYLVSKSPEMKAALKEITRYFTIDSLSIQGTVSNKKLNGTINGALTINKHKATIEERGVLSYKTLTSAIGNALYDNAYEFVADAYKGFATSVSRSANNVAQKIEDAANDAWKDVKKTFDDVRIYTHPHDEVMSKDIPHYARQIGKPIYNKSKAEIDAFKKKIAPQLKTIVARNDTQTNEWRKTFLQKKAGAIANSIDKQFDKAAKDTRVTKWLKEKNEKAGLKLYKEKIEGYRSDTEKYYVSVLAELYALK